MSSWIRGKCIGIGSFGAVSVAVDKFNGDVFAVKSVDRNACHPAQIESLENEIKILRSLSSPYVVKYLGDDVSYESPTMSCRNLHMEYLNGGTVAELSGSDAYADEKTLRSHVFCVVSALKYLHSSNVVHCDVKGKNVLVSSASSSFVKLADFGSAREISDSGKRGVNVLPRGSPLWMAPEVVRGEHQGPESDVWSLGCTIIEMLTGKPAWEDFGADTLTRIGFSDELPHFPALLSELGRDFVDKCLRREPSERWSCDQLLKHPFLQSISASHALTEPSPRCVLDWVNSGFAKDDSDDDDVENSEDSARERIGKLASSRGAVWESDGWLAVRGCEDEGTRREYSNLTSTEAEAGTSSEYPDSPRADMEINERANLGFSKTGGREPRCGETKENGIVYKNYKMYNLLYFYFYFLRMLKCIIIVLANGIIIFYS